MDAGTIVASAIERVKAPLIGAGRFGFRPAWRRRARPSHRQIRKIGGPDRAIGPDDPPTPAGARIEAAEPLVQQPRVNPAILANRAGHQRDFGIKPLVQPTDDKPLEHAGNRPSRDEQRQQRRHARQEQHAHM
ncbi:hypothetical protein [Novosphingobium sp. P6W]|uniref:hypothetical protein n=1 Tax=Novosphingobium sp. P6W TaxID=1609758 RepID=UPI001F05B99D|nr:hypothetical protein [Novosphingobium sp. P6W]